MSEPQSPVTMEFGLAAGKPHPGGVSVDIFVACEKILRRKHGARVVDQTQFSGVVARVADLESYWLSLPKAERKRKTKERPK